MLGILLLILKIIGWVLLGIVCLFLAIFLLVLFVPVPYRLQAQFGESFSYRVRVFGIQVFPPKEKPGRTKRKKKTSKKGVPGDQTPEAAGQQETPVSAPEEPASPKPPDAKTVPEQKEVFAGQEPDSGNLQEEPVLEKPSDEKEPQDVDEPHRQKKKKHRGKRKKKKGAKKRIDFEALGAKWELLRRELADEGNRRALGHGFSELAYILRHFGPRKVKADLAYSLADPANTGYATAALSLCPFAYKKGCDIIPDFASDRFYAKGWVDVRGHVRLLHLMCSGVRLLIDKDIRAVIRKIKR